MSRRTGLGRGLAALIPPSEPRAADRSEQDGAASESSDAVTEGREEDEDSSNGTSEHGSDGAAPEPDTAAAVDTSVPTASPSPEEPVREPEEPLRDAAPASPTGVSSPPPPPQPPASDAPSPPLTATLVQIAPSDVIPNPRQPREVFDDEELEGLAVSLLDVGVLQPIVVRPLGDDRYELVAGERRLRAAKLAGLDLIPAVVRHTDDADLLKEALVENIHRVQLNPLEEAAAYQQLLEEFDFTQEELATRIGKSRPAISNTLRLLSLPPGVQRRVAANVLSAGHAKALLALTGAAAQERLADRVVAEGLSVRATEEAVRLKLLDDPGGVPSSSGSRSGGRRLVAPGLIDLQDDLSDALEARVRISMGARKGKLSVEFSSIDDLERIVAVIANGLESGGRSIGVPSVDG